MVIDEISGIVGKKFVITNSSSMQSYTKGYRFGEGSALLVCRPGSLLEVWKVLEICVKNDLIVIMQAATPVSLEDQPPQEMIMIVILSLLVPCELTLFT